MIEILQETKTSVVCVKPVGIAAQGTDPQALPQLLAAQLGCEVYPVHRLDQTVGGVMVYAKSKNSLHDNERKCELEWRVKGETGNSHLIGFPFYSLLLRKRLSTK